MNPEISSTLQTIESPIADQRVEPEATESPRVVNERLINRHFKRSIALVCFVCIVFTISAVLAFPETDDGHLLTTIKELGANGIFHAYADKPLAVQLWYVLASLCGVYFWPVAFLLNCTTWSAFGILSARLWITLFPRNSGYAPLVACLSVAPIVIQVQTTTLTISSLAVLSTVLGYEALFLMLCYITTERRRFYWGGLSLTAGSVLLSAYGDVVALIAGIVLITGSWAKLDLAKWRTSKRASFSCLGTATLSSLIFIRVHASRPAGNPNVHMSGLTLIVTLPIRLLSTLWHTTLGAYGGILEAFSLTWESKPLLWSLAFGIPFAWISLSKVTDSQISYGESRLSIRAVFLALIAGLVPITVMRLEWLPSNVIEGEFATRFFIPVMPLAACTTALLLMLMVSARLRPALSYTLFLLVGFALCNQAWNGFHRQRRLDAIGVALQPYVTSVGTNVVAVLSEDDLCLADYACTAETSAHWPGETSRRFWLYRPNEALKSIGTRSACKSARDINIGFRPVSRRGPIGNLLWVQIEKNGFVIEPYCFSDAAVSGPPRARTASSPAAPTLAASLEPVDSGAANAVGAAPANNGGGYVRGSLNAPAGIQNLTSLGTIDWAHWGEGHFHHKAGVKEMINYFRLIGNAPLHAYTDGPIAFSWNGGVSPGSSAIGSRTGIYVEGRGSGIETDVLADSTLRKLLVYVSVTNARGKFVAHLSDDSAPDYVDSSLNNPSGTSAGLYNIVYHAASGGQSVLVSFTQVSNDRDGSISFPAVALTEQR